MDVDREEVLLRTNDYMKGLHAARMAATEEAVRMHERGAHGPGTPASGAVRVLRAIERLMEEAGKRRGGNRGSGPSGLNRAGWGGVA